MGQGIKLEPYLGAAMHLAVIKDDLSVYMHTHPENHDESGNEAGHGHESLRIIPLALAHGQAEGEEKMPAELVTFNVNFPGAGVYKLFAQFRPEGIDMPTDESLIGEFYVKVVETGPAYDVSISDHTETTNDDVTDAKPVSKTGMVLVSLVLIAILSRVVYKFIQVAK